MKKLYRLWLIRKDIPGILRILYLRRQYKQLLKYEQSLKEVEG